MIEVSGSCFSVLFELDIYLQPISGTSVRELVDLHKKRLKGIGNEEPDEWERFRYYYSLADEHEVNHDKDEGEEWKRGIHPA